MNYRISWNQPYIMWANYSERLLEVQVEVSGFKEANELIARIKAKC